MNSTFTSPQTLISAPIRLLPGPRKPLSVPKLSPVPFLPSSSSSLPSESLLSWLGTQFAIPSSTSSLPPLVLLHFPPCVFFSHPFPVFPSLSNYLQSNHSIPTLTLTHTDLSSPTALSQHLSSLPKNSVVLIPDGALWPQQMLCDAVYLCTAGLVVGWGGAREWNGVLGVEEREKVRVINKKVEKEDMKEEWNEDVIVMSEEVKELVEMERERGGDAAVRRVLKLLWARFEFLHGTKVKKRGRDMKGWNEKLDKVKRVCAVLGEGAEKTCGVWEEKGWRVDEGRVRKWVRGRRGRVAWKKVVEGLEAELGKGVVGDIGEEAEMTTEKKGRRAKGGFAAGKRRYEQLRNVGKDGREKWEQVENVVGNLVKDMGKGEEGWNGGIGGAKEVGDMIRGRARDDWKETIVGTDIEIGMEGVEEGGRMLNLYEWYQGFAARVRAKEGDVKEEDVRVRFGKVEQVLQFVGIIKYATRRKDHVHRLVFF